MKKKWLGALKDRYGQWYQLDELPFGKTLALKLIDEGLLFSVDHWAASAAGVWLVRLRLMTI
jgi:hypothetical protein